MFSVHACDTDKRVVPFIPSMTMLGSMYGGSVVADKVRSKKNPVEDGMLGELLG